MHPQIAPVTIRIRLKRKGGGDLGKTPFESGGETERTRFSGDATEEAGTTSLSMLLGPSTLRLQHAVGLFCQLIIPRSTTHISLHRPTLPSCIMLLDTAIPSTFIHPLSKPPPQKAAPRLNLLIRSCLAHTVLSQGAHPRPSPTNNQPPLPTKNSI